MLEWVFPTLPGARGPRKVPAVLRSCLSLVPVFVSAAALAAGAGGPRVSPEVLSRLSSGEASVPVLVLLRQPAEAAAAARPDLRAVPGFVVSRTLRTAPVVSGELSLQGLLGLSSRPEVEAVAVDGTVRPAGQVGTAQIGADRMTALGMTGLGRSVAIVDSGLDVTHPDFASTDGRTPKVRGGISFTGAEDDLSDCGGHGTEVAGVVAGPQGVAPDASLVVLKVFGRSGDCQHARSSDVLAAVDWAVANRQRLGIDVLNLSLSDDVAHTGFCDASDPVGAAVFGAARRAGLAVVAAAGNDGHPDAVAWPACLSDVSAVGMVYSVSVGPTAWGGGAGCEDGQTGPDVVPCASNAGSALSLLAPGVRWVSPTAGGGRTASFSGTSAAAPAAAGALLVARQARAMSDPALAADLLRSSGVPVSDPKSGRVAARIDLSAAHDSTSPVTGACAPAQIPDGAPGGTVCEGWVSSLVGTVAGLSVSLSIDHPDPTQLVATLTGPDGTSVLLMNRTGAAGRAVREVFGRTSAPIEPLSSFAGRPLAGAWRLQVLDTVPGSVGRVVSWALHLEPPVPRTPGRPPRPVQTIPTAARAAGRFGSFFLTDVRLFNSDTASPAAVRLYFVPAGQDGREASRVLDLVLPSLGTRVLDDLLGNAFRVSGAGPVHVEAPAGVVSFSRTRTTGPGGGSYGVGVGSVSPGSATSRTSAPLHLVVPFGESGSRVNVGLTELSGSDAVVEVIVRDARGARRGTVFRELPALSGAAVNDIYPAIGAAPASTDRFEIRVSGGEGRVAAFATAVDNVSNDGVFVAAAEPAATQVVPAVSLSAPETGPTTELKIANPGSTPVRVRVELLPSAGADAPPALIVLGAGETRVYPRVLAGLFGIDGPASGSLRLTSVESGTFLAASRNSAPAPSGGTYGLAVGPSALRTVAETGQRLAISFLGTTPESRSRVELVESAGFSTRVRLTLLDVTGETLGRGDVELAPRQVLGIDDLFAALDAPTRREASALVEVLSGGAVSAHVLRVDEVTLDAVLVPAVLVP